MNDVKRHDEMFNESGYGYNPHLDASEKRAMDAVEARMSELIQRGVKLRDEWNAAVAKYTTPRGVSMTDLAKIEKEVGASHMEMSMLKERGAFDPKSIPAAVAALPPTIGPRAAPGLPPG